MVSANGASLYPCGSLKATVGVGAPLLTVPFAASGVGSRKYPVATPSPTRPQEMPFTCLPKFAISLTFVPSGRARNSGSPEVDSPVATWASDFVHSV